MVGKGKAIGTLTMSKPPALPKVIDEEVGQGALGRGRAIGASRMEIDIITTLVWEDFLSSQNLFNEDRNGW